LNSPGNPAFWDEVKKLGPKGNLIADPEARQYSGTSDVSEEDAEEVSFCLIAAHNFVVLIHHAVSVVNDGTSHTPNTDIVM
jgi:hypothetical protein